MWHLKNSLATLTRRQLRTYPRPHVLCPPLHRLAPEAPPPLHHLQLHVLQLNAAERGSLQAVQIACNADGGAIHPGDGHVVDGGQSRSVGGKEEVRQCTQEDRV